MPDIPASIVPRQPRMAIDHPVIYRIRGADRGHARMGQLIDISESGALLSLSNQFEADDVLELEIAAEGELIPARGRVARVAREEQREHWSVGVSWLGIATENLYTLLYC